MARWTYDQYYDNQLKDFPLGSRLFRAFAITVVRIFIACFWPTIVFGKRNRELLINRDFAPSDNLHGARNVNEQDCPVGKVIVANHTAAADPLLLVCSLPISTPIRLLYKSEFDENSWVRWLFSRAGAIPLKRESADTKALKRAVNALKAGEHLIIFPEGTRVKTRPTIENPARIYGGFTLIARMAKTGIVPVGIGNAIDSFDRFKAGKRTKCAVNFGAEVKLEDFAHLGKKELMSAAETYIIEQMYGLRDEGESMLERPTQ